jgi:hypothetical protein
MAGTVLDASIIAENTRDAYSFSNFGMAEWTKCAQLLLMSGLDQPGVEAILRSKHMRWCYDSCQDPCHATAQEFAGYLMKGRNMRGSIKEEAELCMV